MSTIKSLAEATSIFTVSLVALTILYTVLNRDRATGVSWLHVKGFTLMLVGALYFVFGLSLALYRR